MLSIKVLGSGCANCNRLEQLAKQALEELTAENPKIAGTVEKVTDPGEFMNYGLLTTPGLVINEKLVSAGRVPTRQQIAGWIQDAL